MLAARLELDGKSRIRVGTDDNGTTKPIPLGVCMIRNSWKPSQGADDAETALDSVALN